MSSRTRFARDWLEGQREGHLACHRNVHPVPVVLELEAMSGVVLDHKDRARRLRWPTTSAPSVKRMTFRHSSRVAD